MWRENKYLMCKIDAVFSIRPRREPCVLASARSSYCPDLRPDLVSLTTEGLNFDIMLPLSPKINKWLLLLHKSFCQGNDFLMISGDVNSQGNCPKIIPRVDQSFATKCG